MITMCIYIIMVQESSHCITYHDKQRVIIQIDFALPYRLVLLSSCDCNSASLAVPPLVQCPHSAEILLAPVHSS